MDGSAAEAHPRELRSASDGAQRGTKAAASNAIGLLVNLLIVIINDKTWVQSHRMSSSDRILFSLGITFLVLGPSLLHIIFLVSPNVERSVRLSTLFLSVRMCLDASSLWFVTLLNVLYWVKICNFQRSVFLLLKRNLSPETHRLLLGCVLISAFTTLPCSVRSYTPELGTGRNGTEFNISKGVLSLLISLTLSSFVQFIINVTSASLLMNSLGRHIQKLQRNSGGLWNLQTEAHVGAMKLMVYFLLLYILCSVATLILHLSSSVRMDFETRSVCMVISTFYIPGHSVLIILTHPTLKSKTKQILCFNKQWNIGSH
ncbi:LOW QUALITY PROTEIN: taste receptor type 2 member 4 [Molossus nigricans]